MNSEKKILTPSDLAPIWSFLVKRIRRQVLVSKQTAIDESSGPPPFPETAKKTDQALEPEKGDHHGSV